MLANLISASKTLKKHTITHEHLLKKYNVEDGITFYTKSDFTPGEIREFLSIAERLGKQEEKEVPPQEQIDFGNLTDEFLNEFILDDNGNKMKASINEWHHDLFNAIAGEVAVFLFRYARPELAELETNLTPKSSPSKTKKTSK